MMNQRRSIQDIVPPARSKPIRPPLRKEAPADEDASEPPTTPPEKTMPRSSNKPPRRTLIVLLGIAGVVLIVLGGLFAGASAIFHRAEVTVAVKSFPIAIADSFEASPNGESLSFSNQIKTETMSTVVPRSGTETVEERASGTITVLNNHSTGSQRLITNTRFESPDGLIYRVRAPVIIPGYTMKDGVKVPGQVTATVYADEPGEAYNIGASTFTIPGLKESGQDDMFAEITAKSDAPISGGFVGEKAIIAQSTRDVAIEQLRNDLDRQVRALLIESTPEGLIVLPDSITVTFLNLPDVPEGNGARVSVQATATAPTIAESQLAQLIARENGLSYDGELRFSDANTLTLAITESENEGNVILTISGEGSVVGYFDHDALLRDMAGKDRRNVSFILSTYPAIDDMKISVYPFWRGVLPKSTDRISLKVQ
ncbi:hypothetical protein COU15_00335 [Candidatus Kaiserbacteria bacterium CG10_big_fil_rev_8_21_14_0_10_45_20]|uniref:Baseplate protein J-like domain-containing protein n=1 Tax=Candidatus Kaiserbacteria bacterium CG10_big_fil_rev_8_21_14_0_10_45_20 TaxID=1974607 RepID=A0A2H0UGP2_9BACT|nr:MAG: hypothetical protein COU15_00335 [Candidatus Kaiserbacteria bacterium CG10_big_fil_rev_8_21_14_0_10_45_20]